MVAIDGRALVFVEVKAAARAPTSGPTSPVLAVGPPQAAAAAAAGARLARDRGRTVARHDPLRRDRGDGRPRAGGSARSSGSGTRSDVRGRGLRVQGDRSSAYGSSDFLSAQRRGTRHPYVWVITTSALNSSRIAGSSLQFSRRDHRVETFEEVEPVRRAGRTSQRMRVGLLGGHLVGRAGGDLEGLAGAVDALLAADERPHRALEDLEALGLARVQVLGRHAGLARVARLHDQRRLADLDEVAAGTRRGPRGSGRPPPSAELQLAVGDRLEGAPVQAARCRSPRSPRGARGSSSRRCPEVPAGVVVGGPAHVAVAGDLGDHRGRRRSRRCGRRRRRPAGAGPRSACRAEKPSREAD